MNGRSSHVGFLSKLDFSKLLSLGHHVLVLNSHNTTTPGSSESNVIVELSSEGVLEVVEVGEVFLSDIRESNASSGLGVAELSESSLGLDEAEWDILLSAESWEIDHKFDWIDIMGHDNELGLTFFDEVGDVVESELEVVWLWSDLSGLSSLSGFSFLLESVLLFLFVLWAVLGQELEEGRSLVLVNSSLELSKGWWGLESQEHDSLLSLDSDVLWPLDESGEISDWLDISSNSEVSSGLGEERSTGASLGT